MSVDLAIKTCLLMVSALLSTGCYVHHSMQPAVGIEEYPQTSYDLARELRGFVYSPPGWPQTLRADLYLPHRDGLLPVVLMMHGGGWANRSRVDMDSLSRELAERGYAVINLDYRFAPGYRYPAQIEDMQLALAWVQDNAERYRFDLRRINAWGYSSGAHLAALLGGIESVRPDDANRPLPRLRAVVAGGIPADLSVYHDSPIVERFMGGTPADMPERYAQASPLYQVSADDPAVFLYHGKLDMLVGTAQSIDYYDALIAAGVDAELFLHNWRGHMTMFLFGGAAEARAIDFLDRKNASA